MPAPLVEMTDLRKVYRTGGPLARRRLAAVDGVSLTMPDRPEILAIVGQSGSGKTTLARMLLRLVEPSEGGLSIAGAPAFGPGRADARSFRRTVQPVFQNPYEAFSAYLPVADTLRRTADNLGAAPGALGQALEQVGLSAARLQGKYVQAFSGGELQRVAIARALIPGPRLIVADEPVSMVDASLRMTIVRLFQQIRDRSGVSFLFITHDLSTAWYVADRIAIMNHGRIVESGVAREVLTAPRHPYTQLLLDAVPHVGRRWAELAQRKHREEEYAHTH